MNILIIYTHPNCKSFNNAILKQVESSISSTHKIKTIDLYKENFDPVLKFDEENKRRDLAKSPETSKYRDMIKEADKLIFIFPIWWSGMPAILKGFIDRVFLSGFAYSYKKIGLEGHLKGKSAWIITTMNVPAFALPFCNDYGNVLKNQILKLCGITPVKLTTLAQVESSSQEKRKLYLEKISVMASRI
ncbi:NAD(P)H-dependent oxidoreductase [Lachnoanaerobaculum gingivalis]|uniref:NAD(P)H-dependent oxidoreductase n=1 Tax=Lachnoanaerobaculum gingivalis TaxID=2490855 RepID=UPI0024A64854|nr:NAD(P)H-dependent oxidoreductase [Lachnoanaerobaculum gingivalis]WHE88147.1 NAD(P)H-dependent oxidoreductase [Lachnoanaerobaculum gingivalis]